MTTSSYGCVEGRCDAVAELGHAVGQVREHVREDVLAHPSGEEQSQMLAA